MNATDFSHRFHKTTQINTADLFFNHETRGIPIVIRNGI